MTGKSTGRQVTTYGQYRIPGVSLSLENAKMCSANTNRTVLGLGYPWDYERVQAKQFTSRRRKVANTMRDLIEAEKAFHRFMKRCGIKI